MLRSRLAALALLATLAAIPFARAQEHFAGKVVTEPGTIEISGRSFDVEHGSLWVPMNRSVPESGLIRLNFVRFKSTAASPGSPLVYLAGGPGGSVIDGLQSGRTRTFLSLLDERDFIAFDQRGTGRSEPRNLIFAIDGFPMDQPGDPETYRESVQEQGKRMLLEMEQRGVDVRGLTTAESADDIEALRVAVDADKLTLWGSSYGTHLAFATVRRHPESIAHLILSGAEGPDHTFKLPANIQTNLSRLATLVAEDPVYATKMPDMVRTIQSIMDDLERTPRTIELLNGESVTVGKWDFQKVLARPMGSRSAMQEFPARIYKMVHGDFFDLASWAYGFRQPSRRSAMSIVMDCASYGSSDRLRQIEAESPVMTLGAAIDYPFPCLCEVPGMPRLPDAFRAPLHSDVPALFISGTLDGRTPVSNAHEIAQGFSNHQHLVIRHASHGGDLFVSSPAILESVRVFLAGQTIPETVIDGPMWVFAPPFERSLDREIIQMLSTQGYESTLEHYQELRREFGGQHVYDFGEEVLNDAGYDMLNSSNYPLAIDIFRLNTAAWPEAFNTWDSLAEAYFKDGQVEKAIANYEKSLELNPANDNARRMLGEMLSP